MGLVESLFVVLLTWLVALYAWMLWVVLPGRTPRALVKVGDIIARVLRPIRGAIDVVSFYLAETMRYVGIAIGVLLLLTIPYLVMQVWLIMGLFLAVLVGPILWGLLGTLRPRSLREQRSRPPPWGIGKGRGRAIPRW